MWQSLEETADLFTFTEKILNSKSYVFRGVNIGHRFSNFMKFAIKLLL